MAGQVACERSFARRGGELNLGNDGSEPHPNYCDYSKGCMGPKYTPPHVVAQGFDRKLLICLVS